MDSVNWNGLSELGNHHLMPGQPVRRVVRAELLRRTEAEMGPNATILDYGEQWVAGGRTFVELAIEVSQAIGLPASREIVRSVIYKDESEPGEAERRLRLARAQGAHAMIEDAREMARDVKENRDAIAKAKLRTDLQQSIARGWNREEWGEAKQAGITVNIGSLHLDSLRRVAIEQGSNNPLRLQTPDAQVVDAEVVNSSDNVSEEGESTG